MGYTHYFKMVNKSERTDLNTLKKQVDEVLNDHKNVIQYECDINKPAVCEVKDENILIRFNGIDEDGHETFYFDSSKIEFNFCKTARKPYDIVVCKILILLHDFFGKSIEVSSDGWSNSQPKETKYEVENTVDYNDVDGVWGDALNWSNNYNDDTKKYDFCVDDVYGTNGCYFSYKLI